MPASTRSLLRIARKVPDLPSLGGVRELGNVRLGAPFVHAHSLSVGARPAWVNRISLGKCPPCPALLLGANGEQWSLPVATGRNVFSPMARWKTGTSKKDDDESDREEVGGNSGDGAGRPGTKMGGRIRENIAGRVQGIRHGVSERIHNAREGLDDNIGAMRDAAKEGRLREAVSDKAKAGGGRLRTLWNQYGVVGLGTYFTIYVCTLGGLFVIYDFGVMSNIPNDGGDIIVKLQELSQNLPEWMSQYTDPAIDLMSKNPRARNLALAWATCKLTEPVRIVAAIAVTPRIARGLGYAPPSASPESEPESVVADRQEEEQEGKEDKGKGGGRH
ncbi:unnamed protein product [Discosporangium mesarthrocarpum]